jgi:hypothetical protein
MPGPSQHESEPVTVFARTIETVFRKLTRFLVGRVSLANLQEMLRHIYVEEAEINLRKLDGSKKVPLTKLALVTGIDTRTLAQIRKNISEQKDRYTQLPLKELTPESAVVEAWAQMVQGEPDGKDLRELSYDGPESDFEKLFKRTITSRGITSNSLIERLIATNSVAIDRQTKTLTLLVSQFSPYFSDDEPNAVNAALSAISNLVSTIDNNVGAAQEDRFFQRQAWTFRLSPGQRKQFRLAMYEFLSRVDRDARTRMEAWEQPNYEEDFVTAGVGYYFFEESN